MKEKIMANKNEEIEKSEVTTVSEFSNEELLEIADEVIANEVASQEEVKKSEAAAEGEEASDEISKSENEEEVSEDNLEKGNVSTPADGGKPVDMNEAGDTQDEVADHKKKKKKEKDLGPTDGAADGKIDIEGKTGQGETKESHSKEKTTSYYKSEDIDALVETVNKLSKAIETVAASVEEIKKSRPQEEEMRKSITADMQERMAKSFVTEIEELKKSQAAVAEEADKLRKSNEEISKSNEELKKSNEELQKSLQKPASTRQAVTHLEAIEKSQKQESGRSYGSKAEISEALDELRKSGKVTADECISYNVSNFLSEDTKRKLRNYKG